MAVALLAAPGSAQDAPLNRNTLTNRDVVTLAEAGFSEEFLIEMVATSRAKFDTTADGLAELAKHGIKEDVIRAIRAPRSETSARAPAGASGPEIPIRVFVQSNPGPGVLAMAHPQTAEIVKTFGQKCFGVVVTSRREAATFTVVLEHKAGKLLHREDNKMVVFDRAGDMVYGASERKLAKAVRGFCGSLASFPGTAVAGGQPDGLPGAR
jgi:hypothetical protein